MKICGIDFETTGLSAKDDRIIELGAVLWEWETSTPLLLVSGLVNPERPIPEEITKITGITDEVVILYGTPEKMAIERLQIMMGEADYCMAHNAAFDKGFYEETVERLGIRDIDRHWLDTMQDIKFPPEIKTRNLQHLAADHGFVSPFRHRAVFDVLTMLKVASNYSIDDITARANEPTLYIQALVTFDEKEKAKELGFRWYAPQKIWWKDMKSSDFEAMQSTCGFQTRKLERAPE